MKCHKSLSVLCIALVWCLQLSAQSNLQGIVAEEYLFAYATPCDLKPNGGFAPPVVAGDDPITVAPGIYISDEQIGVGSEITAIEPLILWKKNTKASSGKIFVWDVKQQRILYEQETTFRFGYNRVALTTPFALAKGQELFVGFEITIPTQYDEDHKVYRPIEYPIGCDYKHAEFSCPRGNGMLINDGKEYRILDKSSTVGNLALNVYFKNPSATSMDPLVFPLMCRTKDYSIHFSEIGSKRICRVLLRNASKKPVSELSLRIIGERNKPIDIPLSVTLAANEQTLVDVEYEVQDGGTLHLSIPQVDGRKNAIPACTTFELACYNPGEKRPSKPLLEAFVAEWSAPCPKATDDLIAIYKEYKGTDREFNFYCIHDADAFAVPEAEALYENILLMYYPCARVNRFPYHIISQDQEAVVPFINRAAWREALSQALNGGASFYDIQMRGEVDPVNHNKLTVWVDVERLYEDFFADNRIVLALVEDQVISRKQVSESGGYRDYRHPNVLRRFCNGVNGERLTFTDNKASKQYTIEIRPEEIASGDISNFKVIAFIARPYANPLGCQQIFDSQSLEYRQCTSVGHISKPRQDYDISICNGQVYISEDDYDYYEIYALSGAKVVAPLSTGSYIIRIWYQGSSTIRKVFVP